MNADNLVVPALAHGSIAVEAMPFGRFLPAPDFIPPGRDPRLNGEGPFASEGTTGMNADNLVVPALAHGSIAVEAMPFGGNFSCEVRFAFAISPSIPQLLGTCVYLMYFFCHF
jgi:hypothetical protein